MSDQKYELDTTNTLWIAADNRGFWTYKSNLFVYKNLKNESNYFIAQAIMFF